MSTDLGQTGVGVGRATATPGRARRLHPAGLGGGWPVLLPGLVLGLLVLPPLYFLMQGSVVVEEHGATRRLSLEHFTALLGQRGFLASLANSVIFALGSAVAALLIGGVNAWIAERTNAPFRPLAYLTTIISLGTPYVLYVSAWLLLLNRSGPVNALWRDLTGQPGVLINVYSQFGMILIEGLLWSPLVFLLLGSVFRNANLDHEDAARMSGASMGSLIRRIMLPLSVPAVAAVALLVFIRTLEAFEVPALVGRPGKVYVLTTDIYEAMHVTSPPDLGRASALSVLLLGIVAVLLYYYSRLIRNAERFATITGKGYRPRTIDLGPWRGFAGGVLVVNFLALLVLPATILIWASLLPFYQSFRWSGLALLTLDNYRAVLATPRYIDLLVNTLMVSIMTATVVMSLTAVVAWMTVRKSRGAWLLDQLAMMPLVFPGIVLAVGVMQFFLHVPVGLYGTVAIIAWALVINYLPYGTRYSVSGMLLIHRELEEAASIAGAGQIDTFRRVVWPLLAPALLAGWLFVFLLACRVLSIPILLSGPGSQTMAVAMFDLWTNGQTPELAALGLLWAMAMTVIAMMFYAVARRSGGGTYGQG